MLRTHNVDVCWMVEQHARDLFRTSYTPTVSQCADVFTKQFVEKTKWHHAIRLINVMPPQQLLDHLLSLYAPAASVAGGGGCLETGQGSSQRLRLVELVPVQPEPFPSSQCRLVELVPVQPEPFPGPVGRISRGTQKFTGHLGISKLGTISRMMQPRTSTTRSITSNTRRSTCRHMLMLFAHASCRVRKPQHAATNSHWYDRVRCFT